MIIIAVIIIISIIITIILISIIISSSSSSPSNFIHHFVLVFAGFAGLCRPKTRLENAKPHTQGLQTFTLTLS